MLLDYRYTPQEPTSSHIRTYSYSYLKKVAIGRSLNLLFDFSGEIVQACEILICHYGEDLMHPYLFKKNLNQLRPKKMVNKHANTVDLSFK